MTWRLGTLRPGAGGHHGADGGEVKADAHGAILATARRAGREMGETARCARTARDAERSTDRAAAGGDTCTSSVHSIGTSAGKDKSERR